MRMNSQILHQKAATEENQVVLRTIVNATNNRLRELHCESELGVKIDRKASQINSIDSLIQICAHVNKRNEENKQFIWPLPAFAKEVSSISELSVSSSNSQNNKNLQFSFNPLSYSLPSKQTLTIKKKQSEALNTLKKSLYECKASEGNNKIQIYNTSETLVDRKDSTTSSDNIQKTHKIDYISLYSKALHKTPRFISSDLKSSELGVLQQNKKLENSNFAFLRAAAFKVANSHVKI